MRLIGTDVLLESIAKIVADDGMTPTEKIGRIIISVTEAPTVDAVEVVRCKDCKYSYGNKYCTNDAWKDEGNTVHIEPGDFCSYGERRSENAAH